MPNLKELVEAMSPIERHVAERDAEHIYRARETGRQLYAEYKRKQATGQVVDPTPEHRKVVYAIWDAVAPERARPDVRSYLNDPDHYHKQRISSSNNQPSTTKGGATAGNNLPQRAIRK